MGVFKKFTVVLAALAVLASSLALSACDSKKLVQRAVDACPLIVSAAQFVKSETAALTPLVIPADVSIRIQADADKLVAAVGIAQTAGNAYLASGAVNDFAKFQAAVDAIDPAFLPLLTDIGLVKNPETQAKLQATANSADAIIHFVGGLIASKTGAPTPSVKTADLPAHVDRAALESFVHQQGF